MVQPRLSTEQKEDEPPDRFYLSLVTKDQLLPSRPPGEPNLLPRQARQRATQSISSKKEHLSTHEYSYTLRIYKNL